MSTDSQDDAGAGWTLDISDKPRHFFRSLEDLHRYRYLLTLFVYRDLVTTYKQTILGPAWILLQPLLTTLAFVVTFSGILGVSTDDTPPLLFYMCGIICWSLFAEVFTKTSTTFVDNAPIFGKVYFPRLIRPLSLVLASFLRVAIQLIVLVAILLYYVHTGSIQLPGISVLSIIPILGVIALCVYPISQVPESYQAWMFINPLTAPIESFRSVVLGVDFPSISMVAYSVVGVCVVVLAGIVAFHKVEARAMDTV